MTKTNLHKHYVKSYSSLWTKLLFTGLPIGLAFTSPIAKLLGSEDKIHDYMTSIGGGLEFKSSESLFSTENLLHIGFSAFNLLLVGLSLHSLKDLVGKFQQGTERIVTVKINGNPEEIVAKGTLPLSTYLGDIFMIGGTAGYFASSCPLGKLAFGIGGVLGNLICKAYADDTSHEVHNQIAGGINNSIVNSNVNSNNTYIYNANSGNEGISDGTAFFMALLGIYEFGSMIINDSTPGLYNYEFSRMNGESLKFNIEWKDDQYHIYDKYGREIEVLDNLPHFDCSL
jgi:hypothetical protein